MCIIDSTLAKKMLNWWLVDSARTIKFLTIEVMVIRSLIFWIKFISSLIISVGNGNNACNILVTRSNETVPYVWCLRLKFEQNRIGEMCSLLIMAMGKSTVCIKKTIVVLFIDVTRAKTVKIMTRLLRPNTIRQ